MKKINYNIGIIGVVILNVIFVVCGIFFPPQLRQNLPEKFTLMGFLAAASIILLLISLRKSKVDGYLKSALVISYGFAGFILLRWLLTVTVMF